MDRDPLFTEMAEALITIIRAADGNRTVLEQALALAYTCGAAAVEREVAKEARMKVFTLVRQDMRDAERALFAG